MTEQGQKKRLIHYWHFVVDISTRFYSNMEIVKYAYRATDDGARKDDNQSITDTALSIWRLWNTRTEKREREWQWNKRRHWLIEIVKYAYRKDGVEWPTRQQGKRVINRLLTLRCRRQHPVLQQSRTGKRESERLTAMEQGKAMIILDYWHCSTLTCWQGHSIIHDGMGPL